MAVTLAKNARDRALITMVIAATAFGAMAFAAKIASEHIPAAEVAMIRMAIGLLPCIVVPRYRRAALTYQRLDLILYRGFFGGVAVTLYFLAIEHTTAGSGALLHYTAPTSGGVFSGPFTNAPFSP